MHARIVATVLMAGLLATGTALAQPPSEGAPMAPSPDAGPDAPPPAPPSGSVAAAPVPAAPEPPPEDRWWESYEPREQHGARIPLVAVGSALAGIGTITLFAAGITWLTAYGESRKLDDECVNGYCVEGTPGGRAYERTRDRSKASAILVGVSFPLMAGGLAMSLIGGQLSGGEDELEVSLSVTPGGVSVGGRF